MCNWRRWVFPGLLATALLTALAMFFHAGSIEADLTAKASQALQADNNWATVELDGRDLTISGTAPSEQAQSAAATIADGAYDVRVVKDATELLALADPYQFKAVKSADGVTLTGNVPDEAARAEIVAAAQTSMPGIAVTDEMTLARGMPEGFAALSAFGLSQLGNLQTGEASLNNLDYTVSGIAADADAYEAELGRAQNALPAGSLALAEITPPAIDGPYTWTAAKAEDGTITLDGFAPSFDARSAIEAETVRANEGANVVNNLKIATGAPEGFADITSFGLAQLPGLVSGSVSTTDLDFAINGIATDSASFDTVSAAANGALPAGASLANAAIIPPVADGAYTWGATKSPDGSITLSGLMPTAADRDRIAARAQEVNPDATINNQIQIASGAPEGFVDAADYSLGFLPNFSAGNTTLSNLDLNVQGRAIDGDRFDTASSISGTAPSGLSVETGITLPPASGTYEVVATKTDDVLVLTGFAPSNADKAAIVDAANALDNVNVVDRLVVASGAPADLNWGESAAFAVSGLNGIASGTAALRGTQLSIDGEAANGDGYDGANATWDGSTPAGTAVATKSIRLPNVSPYTWSMERREGVVISGFVPSREVKEMVMADAANVFGPNVALTDEQELASGEPRGFDAAVSVALNAVTRLEDATVTITGSQMNVSGVAATPSARTDIERKVRNGVPPGFTASTDITAKPAPLDVGGIGQLGAPQCQAALNSLLEGGQIRFETNEATINEASFGLLDQLAYTAQACPDATIEVSGHTDSDGAADYNQRLSEDRATAVVNYLIVAGVSSSRLGAKGFGEDQPIADNATEEGKAQNRRIEFNVIQ